MKSFFVSVNLTEGVGWGKREQLLSIQYIRKEKVTPFVEVAGPIQNHLESTSSKAKGVNSLRFGLTHFGWDLCRIISRSMEKKKKIWSKSEERETRELAGGAKRLKILNKTANF